MTVKGILSKLFKSSKKECEKSESIKSIVTSTDKKHMSNAERSIKCINPDTEVVYNSLSDAARAEGISLSSARRLVHGNMNPLRALNLIVCNCIHIII